jgi:hypothetical protein
VDRPLRRAMLINNAAFAALRWRRAAILRLHDRARTPLGLGPPVQHRIKNVHRAGRVSGGLLNPSGGARNRPRNKSVLAQSENELNHNFAGGNQFCLTYFQKSFAAQGGALGCRILDSTSRYPITRRHTPALHAHARFPAILSPALCSPHPLPARNRFCPG